MRYLIALASMVALELGTLQAGTVSFSNQSGSFFSFQNMSEAGANIPPSNLETPSLYTNPYDAIQFKPSAFVAVESQLGTLETKTVSSTLFLTTLATASIPMNKLMIDLAGTYYESAIPGPGSSVLATTLSLDPIKFTIGGSTKTWTPSMNVTRNTVDKTWGGRLEVTQNDLRTLFNSPSLEVTQLGIESTATVSATAQWGSANSYLTFLSFSVQPVPEPSTMSLCLLAGLLFLRKKSKPLIIKG